MTIDKQDMTGQNQSSVHRTLEHELKELFDNAPIGIFRSTPEGRLLMANPAMVSILGYSSFDELALINVGEHGYHSDTPRSLFLDEIKGGGEVKGLETIWLKKDGTKICIRENTRAVKDKKGKILYYEGSVEDITEQKDSAEQLHRRIESERLITKTVTRFVNFESDEVDAGIDSTLRELCGTLNVDRCYVFQFSDDGKSLDVSHYWSSEGIEVKAVDMNHIDANTFSWSISQIRNRDVVAISCVEDLPRKAKAEKIEWQSEEIQSMLMVPLVCGANVLGFMGYDCVWEQREWDESTISVSKVIGEIFASALNRKKAEEDIRYRAEFDDLITSISAKFASIIPTDVDDAIAGALRELGEFADVDWSYVFSIGSDGATLRRTHYWCREGVKTLPSSEVDTASLGKALSLEKLHKQEVMYIPSVAGMPDDVAVDREFLISQNIKSIIRVPFLYADGRVGFIGFCSLEKESLWLDDLIAHIKLVAEMFVNAIARKSVSIALDKERMFVGALRDNTLGYIYFKDSESRFSWGNRALAELFGLDDPEDLVGKTDEDFYAAEYAAESLKAERELMNTGKPIVMKEEHVTLPDGVEVWLSTSKVSLRDVAGNIVGTFGISRNITEIKKTERERRNIEAKMQHAQKLESLGVLSGGIAHDFNNLLMGIVGNTGMAMMEVDPDSTAHTIIEQIETAALRAAELTNQMLAYSGKSRFVIKPLSLTMLVTEMAHLLEVSISRKTKLIRKCEENIPLIDGDATQIRQVVMNLITNASDAMEKRAGEITITTGVAECDADYLASCYVDKDLREGEYVFVEVSDTGCGMIDEIKDKIFDPFFTTKVKGRGLGLAAVLGIVRGHKGALRVEGEQGKGTTFRVLFPCSDSVECGDSTGKRTALMFGSGMVLVIDDDPTVLTVTRGMLERIGYSVESASDPKTGIKQFKHYAGEIVAVILDATIVETSIAKVLSALRRIKKNVPIVLVSGYNEEFVAVDMKPDSYQGFLQKPYSARKLAQKLHEVIGRDAH